MEMLLFVHTEIPHFPVQWAVLTLLCGCGRRGHGKRASGRFQQRGPLAVTCQPWHRVLLPREQLQVCPQECLAPLSYVISPCLFLYLLPLSLTTQGSGRAGNVAGTSTWPPPCSHSYYNLPVCTQYKPAGTMAHRNQLSWTRKVKVLVAAGQDPDVCIRA